MLEEAAKKMFFEGVTYMISSLPTSVGPGNDKKVIKVCLLENDYLSRVGLAHLLKLAPDIDLLEETGNANAGMEFVLHNRPHVVIVDVWKQFSQSLQLCRQLLLQPDLCKVIMLLGNGSDEELRACLELNVHGYCSRDTNSERLASAIRSVSEGEFWIDPVIARRLLDAYRNPHSDPSPGLFQSRFAGAQLNTNKNSLSSPEQNMAAIQFDLCEGNAPMMDLVTKRESQVLGLLVQGLTNREIARQLVVTLSTAKSHVHNIFEKLDVHDRTQAAVKALKIGLVRI
jgi:DNA-binding NarL/FixJ family response regulator